MAPVVGPATVAAELAPHPMHPVAYRVARRRALADDVAALDLIASDQPIGAAEPGQFAMLWAPGVGEVPISFSGLVGAPDALQFTVRAVGEVSAALVGLTDGRVIGVRGPFGRGWRLDTEQGRDVLVVAGGIGLVPLWPLLDELERDRDRFGEVAVVAGSRRPADLLDDERLWDWAERTGAHLGLTVDVPAVGWGGDVGLVTALLDRTGVDPTSASAFVCGPEVMMRATARRLLAMGADPAHVRVSLERNMACGIRQCGRCQLGPFFVCTDGPVFDLPEVGRLMEVPAL